MKNIIALILLATAYLITEVRDFQYLKDKNQIIVVYAEVNHNYSEWPRLRYITKYWKDIYGVIDGKIEFIKTVKGKYIPSQRTKERVEWEDDESK